MSRKVGFVALLLGLALVACNKKQPEVVAESRSADEAKTKVFDWSYGLNGTYGSIEQKMAVRLKTLLEERSSRRITLKIYPDGQLGDDTAMIEMLKNGELDVALGVSDRLRQWVPRAEALGLPYIYDSYEHVLRFWNSPAGKALMGEVEQAMGAKAIGIGYNGVRHVTSNRPIRSLADMKGLKLRVPNNEALLEFARLTGAIPTPISFAEVYLALQTNTVDAQENPLPTIEAKKFYEVQDYIALTGHMLNDVIYFVSQKSFQALPQDLQAVVLQSGEEVAKNHAELVLQEEARLVDFFKEKGLTITSPDRTEFREAMQPYYKKYVEKYGDSLLKALDSVR